MDAVMDFDIYGHLLAYQQTDEFRTEFAKRQEKERAKKRPALREGARKYRQRHPDWVKMRAEAAKHKPMLFRRQQGRCYWCKHRLSQEYEVDHIIPLSKKGTNRLSNLCVCCRGCNRRKSNKLVASRSLHLSAGNGKYHKSSNRTSPYIRFSGL